MSKTAVAAAPTRVHHNPYADCLPTEYHLTTLASTAAAAAPVAAGSFTVKMAPYKTVYRSASPAPDDVDDGVSECGSRADSSEPFSVNSSLAAVVSRRAAARVPPPAPKLLRYASVNFRFGSAWFVAPFRTAVGDMVVVEYSREAGAESAPTHIGLVSCVTTAKPATFYTEDNTDPNYLSDEEVAALPRLLRHARDFDRDTKLELRDYDLHSLANAQSIADNLGVDVAFLDAEWMLDLTTVTFLIHAGAGAAEMLDQLADAVCLSEGAEVVFTFPSV